MVLCGKKGSALDRDEIMSRSGINSHHIWYRKVMEKASIGGSYFYEKYTRISKNILPLDLGKCVNMIGLLIELQPIAVTVALALQGLRYNLKECSNLSRTLHCSVTSINQSINK